VGIDGLFFFDNGRPFLKLDGPIKVDSPVEEERMVASTREALGRGTTSVTMATTPHSVRCFTFALRHQIKKWAAKKIAEVVEVALGVLTLSEFAIKSSSKRYTIIWAFGSHLAERSLSWLVLCCEPWVGLLND
jgi:hypothetical protein